MQKSLSEFIDHIRDLLAESESDQAIRELQEFLESDHKYNSLLAWTISISAEHNRLERDARRNLVSDDDLSVGRARVSNQLMLVLRNLAEGKLDPDDAPSPPKKRNWVLPLSAIILIALVAFVAWRFIIPEDDDPAIANCPDFSSESVFNILLFPFREVGGENLDPEISIKDRLDVLCNTNNIASSIRIFENYHAPLDYQAATKEGNRCQAGLVIWGTVEKHEALTDLTTHYKYLGEASGLEVTKLQLEGESQVDTTTSISGIVRQGMLTKNIEDLILTIFGLIAHQEKRFDLTVEALEKTSKSDTSGAILTGVLLADAYLAMNDDRRALLAYNQVLEVHPEYPLALNNRAALQYLQGNFQAAVSDYSRIIATDPDNTDALAGRIATYMQMQKLDEAEIDIENLRRINPDRIAPIWNNLQLVINPKFFTGAENFLSVNAAKEFTVPAEDAGYTLVFAGLIPDGQTASSHQVNFASPRGNYYLRFRTQDGVAVKKTLIRNDGFKVEISPEQVNRSLTLPRGKYKLVIERQGSTGPLYYEVEVKRN